MKLKDSKFYVKPPLKDTLTNFAQSLLFWKGRRKGMSTLEILS